jgi:LPS export ABC transporter protein LptC
VVFKTQIRLILSGLLPVLLVGCTSSGDNRLEEAKRVTTRANTAMESGRGIVIKYTQNGKIRIEARAPKVYRFTTQNPYMEFPEGVNLLFLDNGGKPESTLTARFATVTERNRQMVARDEVVVKNSKGEVLQTEELIWDEQQKIIYSNTFVKITTADEIIMGTGMTANQNFTDYTIKNISGIVRMK